jgi:uncharacterized protein
MSSAQAVKDVYDKLGRRDIPGVLASFDPAIEFRLAEGHPYRPDGAPWSGPEEVAQNFFMRTGAEWDGWTVSPSVLYEAGDTVIVECRYSGTYKPTGRTMDAEVCHIWKVREGRIASFRQYVNTAHLQDVMGKP